MSIGHPDYQDYAQWQGATLVNETISVPPGTTVLPAMLLSNFASLWLLLNASADGIQATVDFFADAALTIPVIGYSVISTAGCIPEVLIPAYGAYAVINLINSGALATNTTIYAQPMNAAVDRPTYAAPQNFIQAALTSVPASTTVTLLLPHVRPGDVSWYFDPADATGKLTMTIDAGNLVPGAVGHFLRKVGPVAEIDGTLDLPDIPIVMNIQNTDAAGPHSYRAALSTPN